MTESDDAMLIRHLVDRGCDLTKQREVGIHFDVPSQEIAEAIARDLRTDGWDPSIFTLPDQCVVSADGKWLVVSEESIAELRRSAADLASRHGVTYHGWQANLDPGMRVE
jgi:hypothetical protein